jgi:8-oxo-dGTP diphosphatase
MAIRNSAKAVIIQDSKLLVIKKEDKDGYYFILPGGGQDHGENLHETLKRECIEEIGEEVEIEDLMFLREYIGKHHEYSASDFQVHRMEFMFLCRLKERKENIKNGISPDDGQIGVEWLPVSELLQHRLYPQKMRKYLIGYFNGEKPPTYLGDIN